MVTELEVGVHQRDLATELAMERDRRVDRDGRRADTALGAVERERPAGRRPGQERLLGANRASRLLIRASSSAGWSGLIR